jgi:hypothetical protein
VKNNSNIDEESEFVLYLGSIFALFIGVVLIVFPKPLGVVGQIIGGCLVLFGAGMIRWLIRDRKRHGRGPQQGS